jgi:hypothetical protein
VKDLKLYVKQQKGISKGKQRLLLGTRQLEDSHLVRDILENNATVTLEVLKKRIKPSQQAAGTGSAAGGDQILVGAADGGPNREHTVCMDAVLL